MSPARRLSLAALLALPGLGQDSLRTGPWYVRVEAVLLGSGKNNLHGLRATFFLAYKVGTDLIE